MKFMLFLLGFAVAANAILFPQDSESRDQRFLDGVWDFRPGSSLDPDQGFREQWYLQSLKNTGSVMDMPVPSSYNDITTDAQIRDHSGWVWYQQSFFTPASWNLTHLANVWLRVGSAHYYAMVWLNGQLVTSHEGGHLPFEVEVTSWLNPSGSNLLTIAVNNTLAPTTIPQGYWKWKQESASYPAGYFTNDYTFDFFNYAGIHRSVVLYSVPKAIQITDITVSTSLTPDLAQATVWYNVELTSTAGPVQCYVEIKNQEEGFVTGGQGCQGSFSITAPNPWWPNMMSPTPGYLYTLDVSVYNLEQLDRYHLKFGIRELNWDNDSFKINHQNFYFRGFGMHEDANIRGKGLDLARITKDFNLIKWTGANSFRTSHYPYAEEIMDFADRNGIVVIDECPGVNLEIYDQPLLQNHLKVMEELIARDKNRPSVVMWSIANEPRSSVPEARPYFTAVADRTRELDPSRPTTFASNLSPSSDQASYAVDIIMVNNYASWYTNTGHLELVQRQVLDVIREMRQVHGKLVMVSEYGADTIHGFHEVPSTIFTEEYQTDMMLEFFEAFDTLRSEGNLIGEMIWNFADFMTKQEYKRVWGNRKGIFTRDRHPKASAHLLRARYLQLASSLDNATLVLSNSEKTRRRLMNLR